MIKPISLLIASLLLLGPVLVVELGVQLLVERDRLPHAPSSNDFADVSLANLYRLGQQDVLIMGASTVRSGIRPDTLETQITNETGEEVHVQGAAQPGFSIAAQEVLIEDLARHDMLPDVVITGISPLTLNGEWTNENHWFMNSEWGRSMAGCPGGPLEPDAIACRFGNLSALWRWRGQPDRLLQAAESGMPRTLVQGSKRLRASGWLAGGSARAEALERNVQRALDRLEPTIEVPDVVVESFVSFVETLEEHDVELVVVRMPYLQQLEEESLARHPTWIEERDAAFALLEEAAGVEIIDTGGFGDWAEATSFRDPRHLSKQGAGPFTRQLWSIDQVREPILDALTSDA